MFDFKKLFNCKRISKKPEVICNCSEAVKSKWRAYCPRCNISYLAVVIDYVNLTNLVNDTTYTEDYVFKFTFTENPELNKRLTNYIDTLAKTNEVKGLPSDGYPYIKEYFNLDMNKIILKIFVNQ